jgi:hypothetical protein
MILDLLTESQLLKKGCAPRSKFNIVIRWLDDLNDD